MPDLEDVVNPGRFSNRVLDYLSESDLDQLRAANAHMKRAVDSYPNYNTFPTHLIPSPDRWTHTRRGELPGHYKVFLAHPTEGETWGQTKSNLDAAMKRCHAFRILDTRMSANTPAEFIPRGLEWVYRLGYDLGEFDVRMCRYVVPGPTSLPDVWWMFHYNAVFAVVADGPGSWEPAMDLYRANHTEFPDEYPHILRVDNDGMPIRGTFENPDPFFEWLRVQHNDRGPDTAVSNLPPKEAMREYIDRPGQHRLWINAADDYHFIHNIVVNEDARSIDVLDNWIEEVRNYGYERSEFYPAGIPIEYENLAGIPERVYVAGEEEGEVVLNPALIEWMASNGLVIGESPADLIRYACNRTLVLDFVVLTERFAYDRLENDLYTLSTDLMLSQEEVSTGDEEEEWDEEGGEGDDEDDDNYFDVLDLLIEDA